MDYLLLVYYNEELTQGLSVKERNLMDDECIAHRDHLIESARYVAGEALQPVSTATTVRVRNGKVLTTDGPFAETKEQLAGFYYVQAKDLNEAIQLAAHVPPARFGSVEVRPVRKLISSKSAAAG